MIESDFCVIGAGIMGSAAAFWLSGNQGQDVLLMERFGLLNEYSSSNDANRVFRYAYGRDEFYTRMAMVSRNLWRELEEQCGQLLVPSGLLLLEGSDTEANGFNEDSYNTLQRLGLETEELDEAELGKRFPQFTSKRAYLDPQAGVLLASKTLAALGRKAKERGVRVLENAQARSLTHQNGHVIIETSSGQSVMCSKAVVTIGAWTNLLRGEKPPPVTAMRQQVFYVRPRTVQAEFQPPKFPVFFADQYYGIPATGSTAVKLSHKNLWDPVDPNTASWSTDSKQEKKCLDVCSRFVPSLKDGEVVHSKVCLYDSTGNSDFVMGPDPENPDIIYGYGFSGHGFKFAPLIGKVLAELAQEKPVSFNIDRFSPSRPHETSAFGPP